MGQVWRRPRTDKHTAVREAHETARAKGGFWELLGQRGCSDGIGAELGTGHSVPTGRSEPGASALRQAQLRPPPPPGPAAQSDFHASAYFSRAFLETIPWAKGRI